MDRVLTANEVAAMIRVPAATLRYWRHQGAGPESFKMGPRRVVYREQDVLRWIDVQYAGRSGRRRGESAAKSLSEIRQRGEP